jgi:sec-independent protein translocase protein TatA
MGLDNPIHIAFLLVLLLLVFGAKRLPEMGHSLGSGLRGFRDALSGDARTAPVPAPVPARVPAPVPAPVAAPDSPPAAHLAVAAPAADNAAPTTTSGNGGSHEPIAAA